MKELPEFKCVSRVVVMSFIAQVFIHPKAPEVSYFRRLVEHEDGHYSAIFDLNYFLDTDTPTKSQWNSLKKKLKRHDNRIFVFKEQLVVRCEDSDDQPRCGQLEFGFFVR